MEHRCGERRPIRLTVLVRRRGWAGWIVAELCDISLSGAYLVVADGTLPLHAQVRIEAPAPGAGPPRLMHCTAMVVRTARGGVGVVFDELAPPSLGPLLARSLHPEERVARALTA